MEASAYSRLEVAKANWQMFVDHPLGAGYRGNVWLSPDYLDERWLSTGDRRAAHNTFLAVLVDGGIPGILLFCSLLGWVLLRIWAMKRLDKHDLAVTLGSYRAAVGSAIFAYVVAGQFANFLIAEVGIWMMALTSALDRLTAPAVNRIRAPTTVRPLESMAYPRWLRRQKPFRGNMPW